MNTPKPLRAEKIVVERMIQNHAAQLRRLDELEKLDKLCSEDAKYQRLCHAYQALEREWDRAHRRSFSQRKVTIYGGTSGKMIVSLNELANADAGLRHRKQARHAG